MADRRLRIPILLSIGAALVTLGLKFTAYFMTGSVGLLSDAAESVVNLVAATTAFFSLLYAERPVDPSHTYGHEKIEFFSSGLEGMLILVAAGGIGWVAVVRLVTPQRLQALDVGLVISAAAALVNLAVAQVLLRVGRKHQSIVLEADGHHLMTDVWTSVAVILGVGLVWTTGIDAFDPICALLMACNIIWTGLHLVRRSFDGLMDHALPEAEQHVIRAAIQGQLQAGMTYHALRTRRAGTRRFVDFHLLVPGILTVNQAHAVAGRIEAAVARAFPEMEVTIHIEPIEEPAAWQDSALLPLEQAAALAKEGEKGRRGEGQTK
jgi:cation diffusion facilitator family transporter